MTTIGIYKITSPSGKVYIGQSFNIEKRWRDNYFNNSCKNQTKLYNSLNKYNSEYHKFEIIEECNDNMDEREIYWIDFYNSVNKGLNIRYGGKGGRLSEETKQKISKSNKGKGLGDKRSEETKQKISESNRGRKQTKEEKLLRSKIKSGTKLSKKHKDNMSKGMMGKNTKSIICINTGDIYNSIREASKCLNLNERSISNNLCGLSTTLKNGFIFNYY